MVRFNKDIITKANSNRYKSPNCIEDYLKTEYYRRRVDITLMLLENELSSSYPSCKNTDLTVGELGAGLGIVSKEISGIGYNVIATDIEITVLKKANEIGLKTMRLDLTKEFPFEDMSINAVYAGEIIEHFLM